MPLVKIETKDLLLNLTHQLPFVKIDWIQVNQKGGQNYESLICLRGKDEVERID